MARTTENAVYQIMGSPGGITESDITPFIVPANTIVTNSLSDNISDSDLLELIERYLAAHFTALNKEKEVKSEGVEGISVNYRGQTGKHFEFTTYGQTAMLLDTTGALFRISSGKMAVATFEIATDIGEDRDYPNIEI